MTARRVGDAAYRFLQRPNTEEQRGDDQRNRKIFPEKQILHRPPIAWVQRRVQHTGEHTGAIAAPQRTSEEENREQRQTRNETVVPDNEHVKWHCRFQPPVEQADRHFHRDGKLGPVVNRVRVLDEPVATQCCPVAMLGKEFREGMNEEFAAVYHDLEKGVTPLAYVNAHLPIPSFKKRDKARVRMVEMISEIVRDRKKTGRKGEDDVPEEYQQGSDDDDEEDRPRGRGRR